MAPATLNLRIADFLSQIEKSESLVLEIDRLNSTPKEVSGNRAYRFVTFTAYSGSSVHEQLKDLRANPKRDRTARGGNFPQINDAALKKAIPPNQKVPEGMVTQYFCYVTNANKSELVTTCTFPKHLIAIDQRGSVTRNPNMLRENSFHTDSINDYLGYLKDKIKATHSKLEDDFKKYLMNDSLPVSGPEMAVRSATDLNSNCGILISLGPIVAAGKTFTSRRPLPKYCPQCFATLFQSLDANWNRKWGSIVPEPLPPIPETSIKSTVYCTENKHKRHGPEDLVDFNYVNDKLNDLRVSLGFSPHQFINLNIENKALSRRLGRWVWLDI